MNSWALGLMGLLVLIAFGALVLLVAQCVTSMDTCRYASLVQAIVAVGLLLMAVFGIYEYKAIRRPYVSLGEVKAKSNLSNPNNIIKKDQKIRTAAELLELGDEETLKSVEEILVDLIFKNTGPVGARDCQIKYSLMRNYNEQKELRELWDDRPDQPDTLKFTPVDAIVLNPQQEQISNLMFHRKEMKEGDKIFILCDVRYNSVKGGEKKGDVPSRKPAVKTTNSSAPSEQRHGVTSGVSTAVTQSDQQPPVDLSHEVLSMRTWAEPGKSKGHTYRILNLYRLWVPKAYTRIVYPSLIRSQIIE